MRILSAIATQQPIAITKDTPIGRVLVLGIERDGTILVPKAAQTLVLDAEVQATASTS